MRMLQEHANLVGRCPTWLKVQASLQAGLLKRSLRRCNACDSTTRHTKVQHLEVTAIHIHHRLLNPCKQRYAKPGCAKDVPKP